MSFKESLISGIALTIKGIAKSVEVVQTATPHIRKFAEEAKKFSDQSAARTYRTAEKILNDDSSSFEKKSAALDYITKYEERNKKL
ncbi:TPA: hypothetical protein ACU8BO_000727 [Neisseria subflava]